MVVRFGAAEFGGEWAERVGLDHALCLVAGQSRTPDEGGPAIVLGCRGDGLVLGGELGDRAPLVLLGDDGLVGGQFRSDVLQNAVQDAACGRVGVVAGVRLVVVVGAVEDHVGMVGVAAAGHGDVEVLPGRGRFDQDMRGVGRDALGPVGGDRVAEIDVLGHVLGGQRRPCRRTGVLACGS